MPNNVELSPSDIVLTIAGYRVTVAVPASLAKGAIMPDAGWLPFSPTEFRVIRLLLDKGALSREEVARNLDESPDGRIKGIMATLTARRIVAVTPEGYRLNMPEANRPAVSSWLATFEVNPEDGRKTAGGLADA